MNKNWREYSIFISSTFTDMDAERDVIKFDVIHRLNQRYHSQHLHFQVIDLRAGINTELIAEEQRENKILNVCFNCIDSARPFFIGLLGNRYGWIPSQEKREAIIRNLPEDRKILLDNCGEVSVTEMEILYGAIGHDGENIDHSLFFYRDPASLDSMDPEDRNAFEDLVKETQTQSVKDKLEELHGKIKQVLTEHSSAQQWIKYQLHYNTTKKAFDGLDQFAGLVYDYLVSVIDQEINKPEFQPLSWWEQEKQLNDYIAERMVIKTLDRSGQMDTVTSPICIIGEPGTGKSSLLSQCYLQATGNKHIAYIGMTPYGYDMRHILIRWMCEMGATSYIQDIPDRETRSDVEIYQEFKQLCETRSDRFFLDNIEGLPDAEQSLGSIITLDHLCVATSAAIYEKIAGIRRDFNAYCIPALTSAETNILISVQEHRTYFEIPEKIKTDILLNNSSAGTINLIVKLLTGLSTTDYQAIRQSGGKIEEINQYLRHLYKESLSASEGQFYYVLSRFAEHVCQDANLIKVVEYLALSVLGLRETDLENVMGKEWNPIGFALMTNFFSDYFIMDPFTKKWTFSSLSLQRHIRTSTRTAAKYAHLAECLMDYPDTDFIKRELLIYFLIKGHCPGNGRDYLASRAHFDSYDDVRDRYSFAIPLLVSDPDFQNDFELCCTQMDDGETATFLSHFLDYGLKFAQESALYLQMVEQYALRLDIDKLNATQSFITGWLFVNASLYTQLHTDLLEDGIGTRKQMIEKGLQAFQRTVVLDPANSKAKNMIGVAINELMEIYIQQNEFEKVNQLFEKYNPINNF